MLTALLLLLGRITCLPLNLLFWSPNKNSSTTSFKLKGSEALAAGRLFPSDNALSQLKCEQRTEAYVPLVNPSGPDPLQGTD